MWYCLSCYLCTVRCPRGIKQTELMHALESLAVRRGLATGRSRTPLMYRSFNDFVYSLGSLPDLGFMTWFYILSNPLRAVRMLPVAVGLIRHGRLSVRARRLKPGAANQLRAIMDKADSIGGAA
jgi:heterodisulfide reductase subunit C